jgi:uncharacterized peroxidase-related enzyme
VSTALRPGWGKGRATAIGLERAVPTTPPAHIIGTVPHIELPEGVPGIAGLVSFRPDTGRALLELADALLRGPSPLSRGERELIAAYVSRGNDCFFCESTHGACAARELDGGADAVAATLDDAERTAVSPKLRSLLDLAEKVRQGGKAVTSHDVAEARAHGADDVAIHDTVLIASAFCMYNRYVDGLATWAPDDPAGYDVIAEVLLQGGYRAMLVE